MQSNDKTFRPSRDGTLPIEILLQTFSPAGTSNTLFFKLGVDFDEDDLAQKLLNAINSTQKELAIDLFS